MSASSNNSLTQNMHLIKKHVECQEVYEKASDGCRRIFGLFVVTAVVHIAINYFSQKSNGKKEGEVTDSAPTAFETFKKYYLKSIICVILLGTICSKVSDEMKEMNDNQTALLVNVVVLQMMLSKSKEATS